VTSEQPPELNADSPAASRPLWARLGAILLIAVAAFLVLVAIAAVALPMLIGQVLVPRLGETLGRQASIERVRFNPFTLELSAHGLHITGTDPATQFVDVDDLYANLSISSLRYLAPVVDSLKLTRPVFHLQRTTADRFNFSDIVDRLQNAPASADAEPTRFALHNLEIEGGEVRLDDAVLKQKHQVTDLHLAVPFISNLDYAATTTVQPSLSALVDGARLNIAGTSLPFSLTRDTALDVALDGLDVAPYLALSPVPLGFTIPKGSLASNLKVEYRLEQGAPRLSLAGVVTLDDLQIAAVDGTRLAGAKRLTLGLERVEPLAGQYGFGDLDVDGLSLDLRRGADGNFPLVTALSPQHSPQRSPSGAKAHAAVPAGKVDELVWSIRKTRLRAGRVQYRDSAVSPEVSFDHSDIAIELGEIGSRQTAPAAGKLSLKQNGANSLDWSGRLDLAKSRVTGLLDAKVTSIAPYLPYFQTSLNGKLATGALAVRGQLDLGWDGAFTLQVADGTASVADASFMLKDESVPAVSFSRLAAEAVAVSLAGRQISFGRLRLEGARVQVERDAAGDLNLQRIVGGPAADSGPAPDSKPAAEAERQASTEGSGKAWALQIARVDLAGNDITWRDAGAPTPVVVPITRLSGSIDRIGSDLSAASRVDLKAQVGDGGSVSAQGDVTMAPWSLRLALQLQQVGLAAFDPYLAKTLTLSLDEGALTTSGQLRADKERVGYSGRVEVDDLRSRERSTLTQTLRWKKLLLDNLDVDVSATAPGPQDSIVVGEITLTELFARVLLDAKGRFNLQDVVRGDVPPASEAPPASAASSASAASAAPQASPSTAAPDTPDGPATARAGPSIRLGAIKLERGRSNFTDQFVQPNYSVNLTNLNGTLSPMSSDAPKPADLVLSGRVDDNAPIEISGQVNPFGEGLYADVRAKAKGIDLPTLTPYSAKYAGYAIERGTLTLDVHYRIENGRLEAQNRVVLDQLTFGERIDSPNAITLPIQFALNLLKNSNGEIDVSLPISGSLNDPQFSIGGIIGSAILNLLTRVITSPFSALAAAFGSSNAELSFVEFRPGTANLTEESVGRLRTIGKALTERPALKLDIAGRVDPKVERDAIQRQRLDGRLKALKRRLAGGRAPGTDGGGNAQKRPAADASSQESGSEQAGEERQSQEKQAQMRQEETAVASGVTLSAQEYPVLLGKLYEDTALPDKPANSPGAARLEVGEIEKQLLAAIEVDAETARRLATRRSQMVRQWLAAQGGVSEDRIFMLAPRTSPQTKGPNQSKPQCLASCAEFSLR
jgi:uncharacterized protein involved in outer membrane biogenesis